MVADDTWSICIGVVDNLLGANCSFRWALSSETRAVHLWGYAGQILRYTAGFRLVNPGLKKDLNKVKIVFLCRSWSTLLAIERHDQKVDIIYIALLAYFFVEWESALSYFTDPFGKWTLEAITTRLKIALSRLHEQGKQNLKAEQILYRTLNESERGQALLPEEYHGFVWSKRREPTAICLPHVTCVDPLHHREGCWCGLIFQSVPLRIIRFYGVLDAADDNGSQWRDFVAKFCSQLHTLGEMNIQGLHKNGRYRGYMRSILQDYVRFVLGAFFDCAQDCRSQGILSFTTRELMVDWEIWRQEMFVTLLYTAAEQLLETISSYMHGKTLDSVSPRNRIIEVNKWVFRMNLVKRKIGILRAQSPEHPDINVWESVLEKLLGSRETTQRETVSSRKRMSRLSELMQF